MISHNNLIEILSYDPDTGIFTWNETGSGTNKIKGNRAGWLHHSGYRYIEIDNIPYAEHRLAWFYCFEEWPSNQIDHIDRNRSNNSLDNLREVSSRENARNTSVSSKHGHNIYPNKKNFIVQYKQKNTVFRYGTYPLNKAVIVRDMVEEYLKLNGVLPEVQLIKKEYTRDRSLSTNPDTY